MKILLIMQYFNNSWSIMTMYTHSPQNIIFFKWVNTEHFDANLWKKFFLTGTS